MDADIKFHSRDLFGWLIVISLFLVTCFYWPKHYLLDIKLFAFEIAAMTIAAMSFLCSARRIIRNPWPSLFLITALVNICFHGFNVYTHTALMYILLSVVSIYLITYFLDEKFVEIIKKGIVILALLNGALFLSERFGYLAVFDKVQRPAGFLSYPANFSLLCAIASIYAWEWKKWIILPLSFCILLAQESSVMLGLMVIFISLIRWDWFKFVIIFVCSIAFVWFCYSEFKGHILDALSVKGHVRMVYWDAIFRSSWLRPIDGWGIGSYRYFVNVLVPSMPKDSWVELHNEPLNLFFDMGFLGIAVICGWFNYVRKRFEWNFYTKSFVLFFVTSLGHSVFHITDSLWIFIVLYACWEIENVENRQAR